MFLPQYTNSSPECLRINGFGFRIFTLEAVQRRQVGRSHESVWMFVAPYGMPPLQGCDIYLLGLRILGLILIDEPNVAHGEQGGRMILAAQAASELQSPDQKGFRIDVLT